MESISHRELRNQSAEVLRRIQAGESLIVTNRGRATAVISPAGRAPIDDFADQGQVRRARRELAELRTIQRRRSERTSAEIVADSRGHW
ncbi:type II toxin-antitoxin system Phd/YefM family antitoxin [Microbacterium thalassium]|uniref:Antitoxin n=1 Tax=Microbacterium thalassium TaxID=362649 RepID=A0A7X0FS77_9MICO|nr:type II toxin-antitoxin system prevent-host-death family antitoxin [Microbacterium thalassium]MBB6392721.1 prevent-host-death family protein [Microbacterium thalassium]GLK23047.1 hypothetical protein GCM10017607_03650 [Microbacterium thalassium]